ncbi:YdcP family protein [Amphibacillus sp. MSJ-3]|nr:YdcP family protein [Amphibacillus sp. MSJ-3]
MEQTESEYGALHSFIFDYRPLADVTYEIEAVEDIVVGGATHAKAGEKQYDYNSEVELVNPVADTVATATFRGADVDWYIRVDNIVLKKSTITPQPNKKRIVKYP